MPEDITVEDSIYEITDTGDFKFAVFGNTSSKNTLTEKLVVLKYAEQLNTTGDCDMAIFAGESVLTNADIAPQVIKTDGYSSVRYKNSLFITMDNSKGAVSSTDADQWAEFIREAENTKAENIFIILPKATELEKNMEETMLSDMAQRYFEGKNLFVISNGEGTVVNKGGVKYITAEGVGSVESAQSAIEDAVYTVFTVSGNRVSKETRKIYNN